MFASFILVPALFVINETPAKEKAPMPRAVQLASPPKRIRDFQADFQGDVLSIDKTSITVRSNPLGGQKRDPITRRFLIGPYLMEGKQDPRESMVSDYRITDVQKGDKVYMRIHMDGDDDICASVSILRRPGGLVPPAPWDDPDAKWPQHMIARAHQAFEEKGIPIPPEIDPNIDKTDHEAEKKELELMKKFRENGYRWHRFEPAPPPRPVIRK